VIAGVDQGGDGEPAAGGLSREGDVRWGGAAVQEGLVGGQRVVDRCRVGVLGGEPVVDGDDLGAGPPADLRGQAGGLEGVPDHVHAAVEVQDNVAGFDSVDGDLGGWDAAQCGCGHGHAGGQWLRRGKLREQPPLLADVAVEREGGLSQDCFEVLSLFGAHGGSPFGWNSPGSTPGGLAHVNPLLKISCREVGILGPGQRLRAAVGPGHSGQGLTGLLTPSPVSRRSDCMIWNVVV